MIITTGIKCGQRMGCSVKDTARIMKESGFGGVDLGMNFKYADEVDREQWTEEVLREARDINEAGLEITQCHLPYYSGHYAAPGNGDYQDFEDLMLPDYIRALGMCKTIGCHLAVMHPYFNLNSTAGSIEGNVRMLTKLLPVLEECDVRIALENVYATINGRLTLCAPGEARNNMSVIERLNSPLVGACIDTGHANIFNLNIIEMARLYGRHLFALHINGNSGKDEHVIPLSMSPWCENLDFVGFSKVLKEIGYQGTYNLELNVNSLLPPSCAKPFYEYAASVANYLKNLAE